MASFSQDVRTNTVVLNAPFQSPCMSENFSGTGPLDVRNISKALPCTSIPNEQTNTPGVNVACSSDSCTLKPSSTSHVNNMCAPASIGGDPNQDPSKKIATSYNYPSSAIQSDTFPCDGKIYPAVHKYPVEMNNTSHPLIAVQHSETFITVPFGWKRVISSGKVIYISPSEIYLHSLQEVAVYLQTEGTCKCGLECPLILKRVFNFNPMATTKCWNVNDLSWNDPTKLCNHKRKIVAMATFRNSTIPLSSLGPTREPNPLGTQPASKKDGCLTSKRKRLKGKNRSPFDSVLVSQLLAQRDKLILEKDKSDISKSGFVQGPSQHMKIQSISMHKSEAPTGMLHPRYPVVEQRKNSPKSMGFVPLEEQSVPVLNNKLNNAANFSTLHMNQNFYVPDNVFQDKRLQGCIQSFQQCTADNNNSSVMFHKNVNPSSMSCVVQDQSAARNAESMYTDRVPPLPSMDHQSFGPAIHQGLYNPQQFLHNNSIPANITLNCNFSSPSMGGQVFSTQLPVNQCIEMNPHNQAATDIVTAVSQSSNPGAFLFHTDVQNHPNQAINNGNVMPNFLNPGCSQTFTATSIHDTQHPVSSAGMNSPRYVASRDDAAIVSRQKTKKTNKTKTNKLNSVLDRGSPCPNVDVRQIPSEHHRPPPEAFAAIVSSSGSLSTVVPVSCSNYQPINNNLPFSTDNLTHPYLNKPLVSTAGQSMPCRTRNQGGNFYDIAKTHDSGGSSNSSPFSSSPSLNKNFQTNTFQPYQDSTQFPQANNSYPSHDSTRNQSKHLQPTNNKISHTGQQMSGGLPHNTVPPNRLHCASNSNPYVGNSSPENKIQVQNVDNGNSTCISSSYNPIKSSSSPVSKLSDIVPSSSQFTSVGYIGSSCPPTSAIMTFVSSNPSLHTANSVSCSTSFYNPSSQSNIINIPMSYANPQSHMNNMNTVYSNQNMACTQQVRQNITMTQQPIVYNNALQNPAGHRHDQTTNFFMQNAGAATLDGMTALRPSLVQQDSSGVLVQQVLSQKISSEYPAANIFSSTARAQVVQQVSGMVLPASASNSGVNSQQLVLAPTQVRMSGSGGLITMLPPTMTSNAMMNGTQVLTGPAQQMGPQMVLPDSMRPNMLNQQQQILQNNCFIMSNQPTFVTRPPHTSIVSCHVPCPTSVSLSFSNGSIGNYTTTQHNAHGTPIITGPIIHKTPDRNELTAQHIGNNDMSIQNGKDQNSFTTSFHVLQSTQQRLPGQKIDPSDMGQENWLQKSDVKNNTNERTNQVTGAFIGNVSTSRSSSVPSNISGHAMISNCGQVLISGDNNNCVHPQTMTASNISRMTGVIPIVGGQCALNSPMPPLSVPNVTAVTTTMTQMIPAIGIAPQILGQPVQPMVQVINTVPFNSMQNAVIVPGGSNVLSQTVRLDTLQTSPVVGTPTPTVFNGVVIPPNTMNCVPPSPVTNVPSLRHPHPGNPNDEMRINIENGHETRGTPGSNSSCSTPASSCSSTPVSSNNDNHTLTFRALSPAVRKRSRDGKRKANSQTVASMLQHGAHNSSAANSSAANSVSQQQQQTQHIQQQQQNAAQLSSIQQQFLQPPVLQTLTVLPQQPRPLLQQPVMNYNSIGSVGGHQILATGLTSPLGIVQPLSMLGVTPAGTVIQNIPVQQVVPGPHFQSLTVLQGPHTVNSLPQEQPVVVNDTSSMGVHPTQMHSAFAAGSIVPNMVTTNPVISTHVGGTEVLVTATSQSHGVNENATQASVPSQFPSVFPPALPPIAQSLSSTTCSNNAKLCRSNVTTTCVASSYQGQGSVVTSYVASVALNTCTISSRENKDENFNSAAAEPFTEPNQKARSIGVQSSCTEQNAAVQTVTSTVPVNNISATNSPENSQNTKLSMQESCLDDPKSKFEGENSSTLLSSGGESCESPWPDPVNLSAAVRAVVQEQVDSNEEMLSHPTSSTNQIVNFLDCSSSMHEETSEQTPNSSVEDIEESNDGNSVLDLRTMSLQSGEFSTDQEISDETNCGASCVEERVDSILHLNNWNKDQLPVENQGESSEHVVENASTASSESSEQTSTDCNVTSDSGVESSQEPMNLACIREEDDDNGDVDLVDSAPTMEEEEMSVLITYDGNMNKADDKLIKKRGIKRLKREIDIPYDEQDEESDDGTPLSPPLPPQPRTFNDGDLVWGQIRGFPSWPGKLVREDEVKGTHKSEDGKLWVRWFGDHTFTQVEPEKLKTLSEGLEAHHRARKRHRRGRKMNTQLENAIQEAMMELDRQSSDIITDETEEESFLSSNISLSDSSIPPVSTRTNKARAYRRR
ncbi:uncharacterized protein LOC118192418 [Stegodyphus dumicola]|uniref:uncharacterized protein LOC118192418 n=1 Tax=Stegodyphus dumicola TaxID=202533 RepID=UPI0015ABCFF2|nr:uncharacterized protein LOC118192418 [Stegodyphus dumicola]XP_035219368.1 uncharacterized protein LOC118192418 [Stegodyphus dumicola]XP_035219436.1 uncharacterized protein LOC118192418 [Stegodyphus dumicola]